MLGKGGGLSEIFLNCGHRQDIAEFPHPSHTHLGVNFVMSHHCPLQRSESTVSENAKSTSRTEVLE